MTEPTCVKCGTEFHPFPDNFKPIKVECRHLYCYGCYQTVLNKNCVPCHTRVSHVTHPVNICHELRTIDYSNTAFDTTISNFLEDLNIIKSKFNSISSVAYNMGLLKGKGDQKERMKLAMRRRQFYLLSDDLKCIKKLYLSQKENDFSPGDIYKSAPSTVKKIMEKLSKGEKLYAAAYVNKILKYGKVSLFNSVWVVINSLSLEAIEKGASFFWLRGFKDQFHRNLRIFLTFPSTEETIEGDKYTMILELVDSRRKFKFVELCTGEVEHSIKGLDYTRNGTFTFDINFPRYNMIHNKVDKGIRINKGETVLREAQAKWEIKKEREALYISADQARNIIGKLSFDVDFRSLHQFIPSERKIKECGIAVFFYQIRNFLEDYYKY